MSRDSRRFFMDKKYTYRAGDVVFIDGKCSNCEALAPYADMRIRLTDALDRVRRRFENDRGVFLKPAELAKHMVYYAKAILPSWLRYSERTSPLINLELALDEGRIKWNSGAEIGPPQPGSF